MLLYQRCVCTLDSKEARDGAVAPASWRLFHSGMVLGEEGLLAVLGPAEGPRPVTLT